MVKRYLVLASVFGGLAVVLGAFGAHGLQKLTSDEKILHSYSTAVEYQFYHALALLLLSFAGDKLPKRWLAWAVGCFTAGIILFSGSLYLVSYLKINGSDTVRWIGPVTPAGGLCLIAGWLFLLMAALSRRS
jgi:uncharacterized membrane protein YgdD (TMEM256/DUF423 family)